MDSSFVCFRFLHMPKVSLLFDENQLMRVNSQILHDQGVSTKPLSYFCHLTRKREIKLEKKKYLDDTPPQPSDITEMVFTHNKTRNRCFIS